MSKLGQFIDVHVTRAQQVVALIVGVIALVSAAVGGVVFVQRKLSGPERAPELSWSGGVDSPSERNIWGPDRPTFSADTPPTAVRINSITDQPGYGDERDFFRIRNATAGTDWTNSVELARKDEFEASIYFHNNSSEESATYAYVQVEVPAIVPVDEDDTNNFALAYVRSSNAQPSEVMDSVRFVNNTDGDFALRYVPGSARVVSDSGVDGTKLSLDSLFRMDGPRAGGVRLGADALDGVLPPGTSGRVVFRLVAQQPDFYFENRVRIAGTKEWKRDLTVQPGARVEVQLAYANTGDTEQRNVVLKADWPKGLDYIDGRTELVNSNSGPEGLAVEDGIAAGGIDIGHYAAGANAYLYAEGIVSAPACSTVGLLAAVETNNGYLKEQSLIRVAGDDCP